MTVRVVVADDQPVVRAGIAMLLDAQPDITVVGQAGDGEEAVELTRLHRPDVVVMDLRMPGLDGATATQRIVGETATGHGHAQVLVLTTFDDPHAVHEALHAGARGFLLKQAAPHDLPAAVLRVAAGQAWIDPGVGRTVLEVFYDAPAPAAPVTDRGWRLTPRESEVLLLVARGMSNADITNLLVLSEATVKTHVAHLLSKTGARDRAQLVALAHASGFVRAGSGGQPSATAVIPSTERRNTPRG